MAMNPTDLIALLVFGFLLGLLLPHLGFWLFGFCMLT
jgi:hypothetical protein